MKILLLEDDYLYRESIQEFLESLGYEVHPFENGEEALDAVYEHHYALLLLDVRVPGMSGYDLLKYLHENNVHLPVIFMTSLTDINNVCMGYELGCSDYIRKPFELRELKYRIQQVLQRAHYHSDQPRLPLMPPFSFDTEEQALYRDTLRIDLTPNERNIIIALIHHKGAYVDLETLREEVWDNKEITYATIRMEVKKIREKTDKELIKNQRYLGYAIATA